MARTGLGLNFNMSRAIVFSGNMRFCSTLDSQIENLGPEPIDWWVIVWDKLHNNDFQIPPNLTVKTPEDLSAYLTSRLPVNHHVRYCQLLNPKNYLEPDLNYKPFYCDITALHQQHWCLEQSYRAIENNLRNYDLIIRSRLDLGLDRPLDLYRFTQEVAQDPKRLIMPNNQRRGSWQCCDQWAAMHPQAYRDYAQAHLLFKELYQQGVPYNPEFLMGAALKKMGYHWPSTDFNVLLRETKYWRDNQYIPEFGQWDR